MDTDDYQALLRENAELRRMEFDAALRASTLLGQLMETQHQLHMLRLAVSDATFMLLRPARSADDIEDVRLLLHETLKANRHTTILKSETSGVEPAV